MMTVLGVACFMGALILPIAGGVLMDMLEDEFGPGATVGVMLSTSLATVGLLVLGLRCVSGHW